MSEGYKKSGDAQVPAVVKERQEAAVEPRQRADAKDDVQQEESASAERADQENFVADARVTRIRQLSDDEEDRQIRCDAGGKSAVVNALVAIPFDRRIFDAHICTPLIGSGTRP